MNKTDVISSDRLVNESIIDFTELNCASYIEKDLNWNESFTGDGEEVGHRESEHQTSRLCLGTGTYFFQFVVFDFFMNFILLEKRSVVPKSRDGHPNWGERELWRECPMGYLLTVDILSNENHDDEQRPHRSLLGSLDEIDLNGENSFSLAEEEERFLALHVKTSREHSVHLMSSWTISLRYLNLLASLIS